MDHSHPKFKMLEAVKGSRNTAVKLAADGDGEIPVTVDKLPVPAEVGAAAAGRSAGRASARPRSSTESS